jgi:membrane dipeptidase
MNSPGRFDFGLNAQQEEKAARLHRESVVFDMLSQHAGGGIFAQYPMELQAEMRARVAAARSRSEVLSEVIYWPFEMASLGKSDLIREWLQQSGLTCGTYGIEDVIHDGHSPLVSRWEDRILRYAQMPWLRYVTTANEIRQAKRDGVVALYANYQPIFPVPRDLKAFEIAHAKGLRSYMLTYNRMDHVGVGCTERVDAGLSMFGLEVVERCNKLGIIVDVSHCGHLTTMDACRHSKMPVTANHTAAYSLFPHARAKNDEALRAIADTGGVIGVVAVPFFLSDDASPTIERMLDHIDYIVELVGWQHLAIGTDWPWQVPDDVLASVLDADYDRAVGFRGEDRVDRSRRLIGFQDCRDLPNITRGLVKRGYEDQQIQGILGQNALRVFEAVCE